MKLNVVSELTGDQLEEAWIVYETAFAELNGYTVQRHLMYRAEFDAIAANRRIDKWLALSDNGVLLGLAVYTNDLAAWPLISPEYFARRWPQKYAERRIWYCGFVAVPSHEQGVFLGLIEALYRRAEEERGVICLDICRHNIEAYRMDRAVKVWLTRVSGGRVRCEAADSQNYFTYETAPAPMSVP